MPDLNAIIQLREAGVEVEAVLKEPSNRQCYRNRCRNYVEVAFATEAGAKVSVRTDTNQMGNQSGERDLTLRLKYSPLDANVIMAVDGYDYANEELPMSIVMAIEGARFGMKFRRFLC